MRAAPQGAAAGDGVAGGAILWPAELADIPTGRDEGRDSGSLPPRGPGAGWLPGGAAEAWTPVGETGASPASEPAEIRWAEQADRVFRRDSRRYDGAFYMY